MPAKFVPFSTNQGIKVEYKQNMSWRRHRESLQTVSTAVRSARRTVNPFGYSSLPLRVCQIWKRPNRTHPYTVICFNIEGLSWPWKALFSHENSLKTPEISLSCFCTDPGHDTLVKLVHKASEFFGALHMMLTLLSCLQDWTSILFMYCISRNFRLELTFVNFVRHRQLTKVCS